jgi:3-methyladenine DNA glycosylase AlkC
MAETISHQLLVKPVSATASLNGTASIAGTRRKVASMVRSCTRPELPRGLAAEASPASSVRNRNRSPL